MRPLTIYRLLFMLLVLMVFSACISDDDSPEGTSLGVSDTLPTFQVVMNDGTTVRTSDLLGDVSVVVLFSVDCGDCRVELPEVQRLWDWQLGVPIVLIARENTKEQIEAFWQQAQLTMSYSPQADRSVYSLFATSRVPRIYVSDAQGVIRFSHTDEAMPSAEQLAEEINSLINKTK